MIFWIYNAVILFACFLAAPFVPIFLIIKGLPDKHFKERLGMPPKRVLWPGRGGPKIWIHAVSIGEVKVAKVIVDTLKGFADDFSVILSTTTKSGRRTALSIMPANTEVIYNPVDIFWCVRNALKKVSPDLFINLETEVWPNFLWACKRFHIPVFLLNGRISTRSIGNYRRFRFLMKDVLSVYRLLSMISPLDARRIISIGADPQKVVVGGNAKYDLLIKEARPEVSARIARIYRIADGRPVFIAGSTRGGEEGIIIEAYLDLRKRYPGLLLVIAPRHIERLRNIGSLVKSYGLNYCLRSGMEHDIKKACSADVIIVDVHGELFGLYSIGTVIFCGASLVPLGGQNILEAAVWGKPVIYGRSMDNFLDAKGLLEGAGAGFQVGDKAQLVKVAERLLGNPEESERLGRGARRAIELNIGSAKKQVGNVFRIMEGRWSIFR
jgi:3-deoxy-D-manno-octulosonic-acid transferase